VGFVEAANVVVVHEKKWHDKHVVRLYQRLKAHKRHGKAATAMAAFSRIELVDSEQVTRAKGA
jgi:hypothetical protein